MLSIMLMAFSASADSLMPLTDLYPERALSEGRSEGQPALALGIYYIDLNAGARRFETAVRISAEAAPLQTASFEVWVDDTLAASSGPLKAGDERALPTTLAGAKYLTLRVELNGIDPAAADWGRAVLTLDDGAQPVPLTFVDEPPPSIVHAESPEPAIHGPRVVGATPGRPFLFKIPATGEGPLRYEARGLPDGLSLDAETGIVTGALAGPGETDAVIEVAGPCGKTKRGLKIVAGEHRLALTPPMGWNSWYACGVGVNAEMVRHAAEAMAESGLVAHGYQYVCIDDCWGDRRHEDGTVKLVPKKFQDMKALGDYVHGLGLKFGIYSSPGPKTCAGYEGSLGHELQDARTFADWGVDYLKYDWCSYESEAPDHTRPELERPYRVMRQALDSVNRDIVYSMCQYGMGDVWEWGADVGANLWRTGGDIAALGEASSWAGAMAIGFSHDGRERFAGPGHWNDPDMLTIAGETEREALDMCLTPNEQIAHFTLWALLAAPLIISCDPAQLDPFAKAVLTNDEVIAIDQDPKGKAAHRVSRTAWGQVWARPLSDKTWAVGLFNTGPRRTRLHVDWADLGLRGAQPVRDLWLRKDVGRIRKSYETDVPPHCAVAIKVGNPILPQGKRSRSR